MGLELLVLMNASMQKLSNPFSPSLRSVKKEIEYCVFKVCVESYTVLAPPDGGTTNNITAS